MKQVVPLLILVFGLLPPATAQSQDSQARDSAPRSPAMTESDRIPFMVEREAAAISRTPSSASLIVQTLGSMCLIVGLIFAVAWALKRFNWVADNKIEFPNAPNLTVISNVSLGANRTLSVVQFGTRTLLIGSTAHNVSLLANEESSQIAQQAPLINQMTARSVSDLLAVKDASFSDELDKAESQLDYAAKRSGN